MISKVTESVDFELTFLKLKRWLYFVFNEQRNCPWGGHYLWFQKAFVPPGLDTNPPQACSHFSTTDEPRTS